MYFCTKICLEVCVFFSGAPKMLLYVVHKIAETRLATNNAVSRVFIYSLCYRPNLLTKGTKQ